MITTTTMRRCPAPVLLCTLLASAALLSACGGGGETPAPVPAPPPPAPATVAITGKAVDGALSGATACYDLNDNGACDTGEPASTATGADGAFTLAVAPTEAGKHRIVVQVPATAVDADTGATVGTAYTLQAPASGTSSAHNVFVSPLTTLVQGHVDAAGVSLADATALVQAQAGLAVSPLADFTAASNADNKQAGLVARLVQATALAQADALKGVAGQADLSGGTITAAEVQKQVASAVVGALPAIAGKAAESTVTAASGAALTTAITEAAQAVVAQAGFTAEEAKAAIGVAKLPAEPAVTTAVATGQLTALRYSDANNWFLRSLQASAADNTPDAASLTRYASVYMLSQGSAYTAAGTTQAWANGSSYARSGDLHWNGSAWVACKLGDRNTATLRDAKGRLTYNYCDGMEKGRSWRSAVDVAGQGIASVFTGQIRNYPGGSNGVAYANWGPANLATFGNASFPSGAKLLYQTNSVLDTAVAYDVQDSAVVTAYAAAVAAGGDVRANAGLACGGTLAATTITTLEDLVAHNPGKPCVFAKSTSGGDVSLDPNEWWSNSTASLAVLANAMARPAGTGSWYSTDLRLRVAFTGGGSTATSYYRCLSRASNGSARNCSLLGTGSYSIKTLGDARVMTFSGLPALMQQAGYSRVFIERGGKVYHGYQNAIGGSSSLLRLNLEAANAVLAALPGMPVIVPTTRHADLSAASQAALTTAKGVWLATDGDDLAMLRIGDGGRYLYGQATPATGGSQTGHELGWLDYDAASQTFHGLVESNSAGEGAELRRSAAEQASEKLTITASQLSSSLGTVFTRVPNDPAGLVGLWAAGSASDLNTQHLLFLPSGKVMLIDPWGDTSGGVCTTQRQGPMGGEYASYSWNAATGALQISARLFDTDGCAGFFDSSPGGQGSLLDYVLKLSADGKTATVATSEGDLTLYRIAPQ
ncbi:hypothetical protein ASC95_15190 [Pelomonas sp. Root1217]|uniref:hypothetical protein n=1 Tax=Pelomonas sp. Root1217 TaxID=1736430 RepID=UPI00070B02B9|nr:hypothetical protein [Pelomonas sp. Root1217]KQV50693.1 hypothetical protein ASC95_15190 [Pelomonas sp. Root1217]